MVKSILLTLFCLIVTLAPVQAAKTKEVKAPEKAAAPVAEAMVILDGKPLFPIKVPLFSFSPADRASTISARIEKLAKDPFLKPESIKAVSGDSTSDIVAGDKVLLTVTADDATAAGKDRAILADELAKQIRTVLEARNQQYSTRSILFGALYSLLATIALAICLSVLNRIMPKIIAVIESWRGVYIKSISFQSIEVLNEDRMVGLLASLARWTRIALVMGLLYLYLPLVLSFFPWTRGIAAKLFDYIVTPVEKVGSAVVGYLPNIFFLLVIAVLTHYTIKFTRFLFNEVEKKTVTIPGFYSEWAEPSFKIVRFLIIAFAAVVAFPYLPGSESPAFKGISVFLGVLFSLGSSSAISNIVAGVILTYMRAFTVGDRVKIADTMGDIVEKTLLVTRIRTNKNVDITIPNSMIMGSHIINYSSSANDKGLILHTTITIGYDAPWRQVHELLLSAARATENILDSPAPFVLQTSLDDFYVSYQINAYTDKPSIMARTYSELHANIQEKFNEGGVEIMSPHYATLRDGNMTTIPESYLPDDYKVPGFRMKTGDV